MDPLWASGRHTNFEPLASNRRQVDPGCRPMDDSIDACIKTHYIINQKIILQLAQGGTAMKHGCGFSLGFFSDFFCLFFVRASNMSYLQHFQAKLTHFTLARQHPQHRFQHPPHVRPTSLASPTNRGQQSRKSSWRVDGVKKMMIQIGGHFTL